MAFTIPTLFFLHSLPFKPSISFLPKLPLKPYKYPHYILSFSSHRSFSQFTSEESILEAVANIGVEDKSLPAIRINENDLAQLTLIGFVDFQQAPNAIAAGGGEVVDDGMHAMVVKTAFPGHGDEYNTVSTRLVSVKDEFLWLPRLSFSGNIVQGFTPHIITVAAGEDVGQKIMVFLQQSKHDMCIISASGSVSNASLRQPSTSGGTVTYEGQFDILSLSGSYMCTELSGRTGGLSVCLSSTDGQIIGGGVGGPLTAAGPIQVIVGTFLIDTKKDMTGGVKGDATARKLQPPVGGASVSGVSFRPPSESPNQNVSGNQFMIHRRNMQFTPTDSMDWRGKTGHSALDSPEKL